MTYAIVHKDTPTKAEKCELGIAHIYESFGIASRIASAMGPDYKVIPW